VRAAPLTGLLAHGSGSVDVQYAGATITEARREWPPPRWDRGDEAAWTRAAAAGLAPPSRLLPILDLTADGSLIPPVAPGREGSLQFDGLGSPLGLVRAWSPTAHPLLHINSYSEVRRPRRLAVWLTVGCISL
jgi:hypothetical protein